MDHNEKEHPLTDEELREVRSFIAARRTISSLYGAARTFAIGVIGFTALALTFKQSIQEAANFLRSLFK